MNTIKTTLFFLFILFFCTPTICQITNDECISAYSILDPIDWCSGNMELSTNGATPSTFGSPSCFDQTGNDVWFSFTAFATAINIVVNGSDNGNTLPNVQVALYFGSCTGTISELACDSDVIGIGAISILENGLRLGETYFIRVSGRNGISNSGFFTLCTQNYNPPVEPGQDCFSGSILCDKSPFVVQVLSGGGAFPDEGDGTCLEGGSPATITEDQSTWLKWTAATNGSLTFTITPLRPSDDIDFALFELSDIDGCGNTIPLRCVATSCSGPTGLDLTSTDFSEDFNCEADEDGFVQFIDMEAGKHYGLLINNFTNSSIGFGIEFGGTGEFAGPKADFLIDPPTGLRCDQDFIITNNSSYANGTIVGYEWNFGERAFPMTANTVGPHNVNYESFGQKFIVLTVISDNGCRVTQVEPLYAEPCCDDIDMLDIDTLEVFDPLCSYLDNGSIVVEALGSNGEYLFKINNGNYQTGGTFDNLPAGEYEVGVIDIKGCQDSIQIRLVSPPEIKVSLPQDTTIELGDSIEIEGSFSPFFDEMICWLPTEGISDTNSIISFITPPGTTTYSLIVKDEFGCEGRDEITINTEVTREIHSPNVFSPFNSDGVNDYFNLFGNRAIESIESLQIYDRWGNLMYEGSELDINNRDTGWDGTFNGQPVNPGVYVWYARVRFLDKVIVPYSGDITILGKK